MNDKSKAVSRQRLGHISLAYTPFGFLQSMEHARCLAFNGQWLDGRTQGYLLGSGERLFLPALMRFSSPDSMSPFGRGGVNAYMYCGGDPVNHTDPSGNARVKTGFGKFMKQNNVNLAQRTRAKKFLREPMQALAEQKGTFGFTAKVGSSHVEVNVVDGKFSYESRKGFDLLSETARYQKDGIVVSLHQVPMMPARRGFSSTMDLVATTVTVVTPPLIPEIPQPAGAMVNLRAGLPIGSAIDSSEA